MKSITDMEPVEGLHKDEEAIRIARRARRDKPERLLEIAPPHELYRLARGDALLYNHAMYEAGHIVSAATGKPLSPCPFCGAAT